MTSNKNASYDVILLGGGLMGSSAAWHLAKQGKKAVLLEKQGNLYESGSSKGLARITRSSNIEDNAMWSYLNDRSVREVEQLVHYLNRKGVKIAMEDIYTTSPISYIARQEELERLRANLKLQGLRFEIASNPEEGEAKFGVQLQEGTFLQREYKTYSGTFNPQRLIQALHQAITFEGGKVSYRTEVTGIERKDDRYEIAIRDSKQHRRTLSARQLVSAAGPYTGSLLQHQASYFRSLIRPKRVFLAFFELKDLCWRQLSNRQKEQLKNGFPVIDRSPVDQAEEFFAMIEGYGPKGNPILKTGGHFKRSSITDPDEVWRQKLDPKEITWSQASLLKYLSILNVPIEAEQLRLVDQYSCIYSLTETEVPYVTQIPDDKLIKDDNFVVIAGLSGVGAKGAMAYGLLAAQLLSNERDTAAFSQEVIAQLGYDRLLRERAKN